MKRIAIFLAVAGAIAVVPVFAQLTLPKQQKTIPGAPRLEITPPKWTAFEYQVFEITDPSARPPGPGLPAGRPRLDSEGRIVFDPSGPINPIEIGNAQFQQVLNEMGQKGWELIQLAPRVETGTTRSYRAVFKREAKLTTVRPVR